ncbi:MAG: CotH kinase family protein, partial [Paludibacteraceae bacterium]|nr:CotH kinase family protein [Paludibacteraceae bacterium]
GYYRCKMTRFSTSTNSNEDIYSNVIQVTAGSNCTSRTVCSKLPVIVVQTNVESFPTGDFLASNAAFQNAKKKISVDVKIIWDDTKDDTDNTMTEADFTNPNRLYYDKKARMNYRGSSSLNYPKKNYAFTVGDDSCTLDGTWIKDTKKMFNINEVNKERDFILYAAYSDPTMMRNKLALDLYSDMTGSWNSKSRYVELYVDGEYKGVYIFMEKVKEDKGRVQVQEDGYIFKFDKTDVWDRTTSTEGARSTFVSTITGTQGIPTYGITVDHGFEIDYPEWKEEDFTPEQWTTKWTYLRNRINDFENALKNGNFTAVNQYIDYESWADYFIMQEFAKNIDGYRISVWFTMETATSPIKMNPIWDFELSFNIKNITGKGNTSTTGLMVENPETRTDDFAIPFWWTGAGKTNVGNGLLDDNCFKAKVKERWLKHTTTGGALSQTNIRAKIDDMHTSLLASSCSSTPVSREFAANARWNTSWAADTTNINTWINPTTGRRKGLDDIISTWPTILSSATINTVNDVNLGDNVTFTATVSGTGTFSYSWYYSPTNTSDRSTWTLLVENGTANYQINNVQSSHDGYYHCIVKSNTCTCITETLTTHLSLDTKVLTVISANTNQGTVTGGGSYTNGSTATLVATPKPGFRFLRWQDNNTEATRNITVTANATYIAYFTLQMFTITLSGDNGTFTGAGSYMSGQTANITAIPDSGYDFVKWSDNDTNASRSITVTDNVTLTATFAIKQYTVSLTAGTGGNVSGAGNYNHGQSVTITATPSTGYNFVKWSDNVTTASRTFNASENLTLTATFAIKQYTVTLTAGTGGNVTGAGNYNHGQSVTITATPTTGYDFVKWSDNNTNASRSITVTDNISLTAQFSTIQYTISTEIIEGGHITGGGNYPYGTKVTLVAVPDEDYTFYLWNDGHTSASREITVTEDKTYIAYFEEKVYTEVVEKQPTEYIVYSKNQTIFVEAPDGSSIHIQDMMGRLLAKNTPTLFVRNSGIYFIHINDTIVKLIVN